MKNGALGVSERRPNVAVSWQDTPGYPELAPFHAPVEFPEYPFGHHVGPANDVYRTLREALFRLGYDGDRFGTRSWNPLGNIVRPGDTVVIKPNLIAGSQKNGLWHGLITHGSILRAAIDYVYIALQGRGRIVVADAPQEDSDIAEIKRHIGIEAIQAFYQDVVGFPIEFLDLRQTYRRADKGIYIEDQVLPGDPAGTTKIDLGRESCFAEIDPQQRRYYGSYYDIAETNLHHGQGVHEYLISRTALSADVFLSLPKLKTHKKVGVTLNLKGLVGINGQKNWLPHYAIGGPEDGGDQFDRTRPRTRLENALVLRIKRSLQKRASAAQSLARHLKAFGYRVFGETNAVVRSGNWYGNDTCWRMTLDLNKVLLWYDGDGRLRESPRRYFSIVDGITGMEGDGPVNGRERPAGLIAAGPDPALVDCVCAALMGFDYRKIPLLTRAFDRSSLPLTEMSSALQGRIVSNRPHHDGIDLLSLLDSPHLDFAPHFGWTGHIEITR